MTAPSTNVPQALADEIASITTPADEAHQAEQNHWIDPLDAHPELFAGGPAL